MKKFFAMFVAMAIGLVFVSTVFAQTLRMPKLKVTEKMTQQVCFPLEGSTMRMVTDRDIKKVASSYLSSDLVILNIVTEDCDYKIAFNSLGEAASVQNLITRDVNILIALSIVEGAKCTPPREEEVVPRQCDAYIKWMHAEPARSIP